MKRAIKYVGQIELTFILDCNFLTYETAHDLFIVSQIFSFNPYVKN